MMSPHHSVDKKKKVTTDEISPAGLKAPLGGYGGAGPLQWACRVALDSAARLAEDRSERARLGGEPAVWGETIMAWPAPRGMQGHGCWVEEAPWQ